MQAFQQFLTPFYRMMVSFVCFSLDIVSFDSIMESLDNDAEQNMKRDIPVNSLCSMFGVSRQTVWRWIHKGCRGRKLEAWAVGGSWYTSEAAIEDFKRRPKKEEPAAFRAKPAFDWRQRAKERHGIQ